LPEADHIGLAGQNEDLEFAIGCLLGWSRRQETAQGEDGDEEVDGSFHGIVWLKKPVGNMIDASEQSVKDSGEITQKELTGMTYNQAMSLRHKR
jgi:hypothetical protein